VSAPVTILLTILNGFCEAGSAFGIVFTLFLVRMILGTRKSEGLRAMEVLWKLGGLVAGTRVGLESILLGIGMGNLLLVVPGVADLALLSWWSDDEAARKHGPLKGGSATGAGQPQRP
jgi:hypothetical protein